MHSSTIALRNDRVSRFFRFLTVIVKGNCRILVYAKDARSIQYILLACNKAGQVEGRQSYFFQSTLVSVSTHKHARQGSKSQSESAQLCQSHVSCYCFIGVL